MGLTWRCVKCVNFILGDANLWNNLGFSLCAVPSVYYMATTSDE